MNERRRSMGLTWNPQTPRGAKGARGRVCAPGSRRQDAQEARQACGMRRGRQGLGAGAVTGESVRALWPRAFLNEAALAQKAAGQGEWTVLSSTSRTWFCQTGKKTDGPQPAGRACPQGPTAPPYPHPLRPGFSRDCAMRRGVGSERTLHRLGIKTI